VNKACPVLVVFAADGALTVHGAAREDLGRPECPDRQVRPERQVPLVIAAPEAKQAARGCRDCKEHKVHAGRGARRALWGELGLTELWDPVAAPARMASPVETA